LVDVEEPPVVDLLARDAPVREPVVLLLQERIDPFDVAVAAILRILLREHAVDRGRDLAARIAQLAEPALDDLLLARTLGATVGRGLARGRQVLERTLDRLQLLEVAVVSRQRQSRLREREDRAIAARRGRPAPLVVRDPERAAVADDRELAALELEPELLAEHGQQDLVRE